MDEEGHTTLLQIAHRVRAISKVANIGRSVPFRGQQHPRPMSASTITEAPARNEEAPMRLEALQQTNYSKSNYQNPSIYQARFTDQQSDQILKSWICEHGTKQIREEFQDFSPKCLSYATSLIWGACERIEGRGDHPDIITITQELQERNLLEQVEGAVAVMVGHQTWAVVNSAIGKLSYLYQKREDARIGKELLEGTLTRDDALKQLTAVMEASRGQESLFTALLKGAVPFPKLKEVGIPPRRPIIGDWFCESDLGFVFAPRGLGKTWFALGLGVAIGCKTEFGPWKVHDHAPVLYVDGEMPCQSLEERIAGLGGDGELNILNHESLFHLTGRVLNLTEPKVQQAITRLCLEKGFKVLILDNLSCLFSGMKENDADSWESVLPWLLELRRNRIAVVIVAHSGRSGQNMRGTSRREDAAFFVIRLDEVADKGAILKDGARFISRFTKDRNSQSEQPAYEWTFQTGVDGKTIITTKEADGLAVLIEWVRDGLTTPTEIGKEMGLSTGQVSKMANRAIEAGKLRKDGRGYALP